MKRLIEMFERIILKFFFTIRGEKGQTLVEYALLLVMIALLVYIMLRGTGLQINSAFSTVNSQLVNP